MNASVSSVRGTRRSIVIPLALLMGVMAIVGFWRTYFGALFAGRSEAEGMIHLHAAIFMGWIAIVIAQSWFAIQGRIALHIRFGKIGMAYGVALVVFGLYFSLTKFAHKVAEVGVDGATGGFLAPFVDSLTFAILLGCAWFTRKRPEYHRRFIFLATLALIIVPIGRLFGGTASVAAGDVIPYLLIWLSPLMVAMAWDGWRHRIVHPVYVFGALLLIALRYRQVLRDTDGWMAISHWIAERLA